MLRVQLREQRRLLMQQWMHCCIGSRCLAWLVEQQQQAQAVLLSAAAVMCVTAPGVNCLNHP